MMEKSNRGLGRRRKMTRMEKNSRKMMKGNLRNWRKMTGNRSWRRGKMKDTMKKMKGRMKKMKKNHCCTLSILRLHNLSGKM